MGKYQGTPEGQAQRDLRLGDPLRWALQTAFPLDKIEVE